MIQACVIFYNDGPRLLERCFKSLQGKVDKILAIDGPFADFEYDKPHSTDGCLDIARRYADRLIECSKPWESQIVKRNACLTLDNPNDLYLIIDADEYLEGFIDRTLDGDAFGLDLVTGDVHNTQIRIFRHKPGLCYKEKHAWVWDGKRIINHPDYNSKWVMIDTCKIIHTPGERGEFRLVLDNKYVAKRKEPARPKNYNPDPPPPASPHVYLKYSGRHYDGWDDKAHLKVGPGMTVSVSVSKAAQLQTDYPGEWADVPDPSKQAMEELRKVAANAAV